MKYQVDTVAEHSLVWELLPERANILDLGCRGFLFSNFMGAKGHNVVCVDADWLPQGDHHYIRAAVWDQNGFVTLEKPGGDPQAVRVNTSDKRSYMGSMDTRAVTLATLTEELGIAWDLIKIDVEGAELQIIRSLEKAPAKQLSIEFHLHTGIYTQTEVGEMEAKLGLLGYEKVRHKLTEEHGMGYNYWDSLFVLS